MNNLSRAISYTLPGYKPCFLVSLKAIVDISFPLLFLLGYCSRMNLVQGVTCTWCIRQRCWFFHQQQQCKQQPWACLHWSSHVLSPPSNRAANADIIRTLFGSIRLHFATWSWTYLGLLDHCLMSVLPRCQSFGMSTCISLSLTFMQQHVAQLTRVQVTYHHQWRRGNWEREVRSV